MPKKGGTSGSHFCFGNDLTQRNRVQSVIPNAVDIQHKPSKVEVWVFKRRD